MAEMKPIFTEPAEQLWFGVFSAVIDALRGEDVHDEALRIYDESRPFDDAQYRSLGSYGLAVVEMLRGNVARVVEIANEDDTSGVAGTDGAVYGARAAIWHGDLDAARAMRAAFESVNRGRRMLSQRASMDAGIAMLEGRRDEARAQYAEAQRVLREIGARYWLGMTDLDIVVTGAMEPDERRRAADEAREIFTALRATALLDRLDSALAAAEPTAPSASASRTAAAQASEVRQGA